MGVGARARRGRGVSLWRRLGGTDVMVAVKADIGSPAAETPCDGRLQCSVEISASAGTDYQGRLGDSLGGELGKALERSLLGATSNAGASLSAAASGERGTTARDGHHGAGAALDMAALGIQKGKTAWVLQVDALVLNAEGSLLDALSIAVKAALADTKIPKVTAVAGPGAEDPMELELEDDPEECARLDVAGGASHTAHALLPAPTHPPPAAAGHSLCAALQNVIRRSTD